MSSCDAVVPANGVKAATAGLPAEDAGSAVDDDVSRLLSCLFNSSLWKCLGGVSIELVFQRNLFASLMSDAVSSSLLLSSDSSAFRLKLLL